MKSTPWAPLEMESVDNNPVRAGAQLFSDAGQFLHAAKGSNPRCRFHTVWFTTRDWSARHADQARAFARTIAQAAIYTNSHQAETAPLMAQATNVELGVIQHMQRVANGIALVPSQLQPIINAASKYGLLRASFPAIDVIDRNAVTR